MRGMMSGYGSRNGNLATTWTGGRNVPASGPIWTAHCRLTRQSARNVLFAPVAKAEAKGRFWDRSEGGLPRAAVWTLAESTGTRADDRSSRPGRPTARARTIDIRHRTLFVWPAGWQAIVNCEVKISLANGDEGVQRSVLIRIKVNELAGRSQSNVSATLNESVLGVTSSGLPN